MYSRVNYTIVGIFVLLFGTGLVLFFFWLAKFGIQEEFQVYKTYMSESVSGLSKDSVVKLHGVDIGRVSGIRIDPNNVERVEIEMQIKAGTPIKEDMEAHTQMLGITGLLGVEIDGGSNAAKILKPQEGKIPVIPSKPSWFSQTTGELADLAGNLTVFIEKTKKLMTDENIAHISHTLENLEKITAKAEDVESQLITSMQVFDTSLKEYNASVAQVSRDFSSIKNASLPAIDKLYKTTQHFNRLTLKVEKSLERGDYDLKTILDPMMVEINILSEQINDIAKEFKQSPSDIFFKSRKRRRGPGE